MDVGYARVSTPGGQLVFHVFGALAEFERDLIRERTHAGLAAACALYDGGQTDVATICQTLGVSRATLYRALKGRAGHAPSERQPVLDVPLQLLIADAVTALFARRGDRLWRAAGKGAMVSFVVLAVTAGTDWPAVLRKIRGR